MPVARCRPTLRRPNEFGGARAVTKPFTFSLPRWSCERLPFQRVYGAAPLTASRSCHATVRHASHVVVLCVVFRRHNIALLSCGHQSPPCALILLHLTKRTRERRVSLPPFHPAPLRSGWAAQSVRYAVSPSEGRLCPVGLLRDVCTTLAGV
ncbi:hypothetical protein MRX96_014376 [Rhipicephalus microplus]